MLHDRTFERYSSEVLLDVVGSFDQGELDFFIWECVLSSVLVREISLSMKLRIVKNICASFEVFYFRLIDVLLR